MISGQDAGVRRYPAEYQHPPGGTGVNKPRDQDSFTRIPDLVKYNLDDSSQPQYPRKPASANENEILAKEFLIPGNQAILSHLSLTQGLPALVFSHLPISVRENE